MTHHCEICNKTFQSRDALNDHNRGKHPEKREKPLVTNEKKKKIKTWFIVIAVVIGLVWLISFLVSNITTLPPSTMEGHVEASPPSHILKEPMNLVVHKHMLEHADGKEGGRGGIIINYNCDDFTCENGLIEKLEAFAVRYPEHVYVAPFYNMDARLVLTKLNQQKILDEYNENVIDNFVR